MSLLDERCFLLCLLFIHTLSHQLLNLVTIMLIESHIVVANQVVAFLTGRFGCLTIAVFQPGKHRLTDVDTAVVYDIGLHHLVTISLHDLSQRPTQQVVTYMTKVEWLVGIG